MKQRWVCSVLLAAAMVIPSAAQVSVYIRTPPPPLRWEARSDAPGPGYVWAEGYWAPDGRRYRWVSGHWDQPPFEGARWSHPHYDHYQEGWQLHEGHWDHEDHDNGYWRDHDRHDHDGHDHDDHDRH